MSAPIRQIDPARTQPKRFLGLIPARGGSKGIPRKNIRPLLGKPLLNWTVECALASGVCERVIASTDDSEIAEVAQRSGAEVPFVRPAELASDTAPTALVVRHALEWLERERGWYPDYVMILEPTSPARRPRHIQGAADLLLRCSADTVASVSPVPHHFHPRKVLQLGADAAITGMDGVHIRDMVHRRQDLNPYYAFNGLIFACAADVARHDPPTIWGDRVVGYQTDSKYALDIDEPEDWDVAEMRLRQLLAEEDA